MGRRKAIQPHERESKERRAGDGKERKTHGQKTGGQVSKLAKEVAEIQQQSKQAKKK